MIFSKQKLKIAKITAGLKQQGKTTLGHLDQLAAKEYYELLASFHNSGQCYNPFYTTRNAPLACVRVGVCGMW